MGQKTAVAEYVLNTVTRKVHRHMCFSMQQCKENGILCRQLLEILAHSAVRKHRIPVLIACNKSDEGAKAHTVDFVRKRLEREM